MKAKKNFVKPTMLLVGALLMIGVSSAAQAFVVHCGDDFATSLPCEVGDTNAAGILNLDVEGVLYDVELIFEVAADIFTIPLTFEAEQDALAASIAVSAALNTLPDVTTVDQQSFYNIPFEFEIGVGYAVRSAEFFDVADGWQAIMDAGFVPTPGASSWADFTPAVIPVPAAVWLFGSALGLLGWLRRKSA
jgi:hypothetical protein